MVMENQDLKKILITVLWVKDEFVSDFDCFLWFVCVCMCVCRLNVSLSRLCDRLCVSEFQSQMDEWIEQRRINMNFKQKCFIFCFLS